MMDKCEIHCSDHLCKFNMSDGYYGRCIHPDVMKAGAYGGIIRSYTETCKKREPIPGCIARGPGKMAVFFGGSAGCGKSPLTPFLNRLNEEDEDDCIETD